MNDLETYQAVTMPILYAVLICSALEGIVVRFFLKRAYDWRAALASFGVFVGYILAELVPLAIALPGAFWLYDHRLFEPEKLGVGAYILLFVAVDFLYYWAHRIGHRVRWFWVSHGVHHTPNDLNIMHTMRNGWTHRVMVNYIIYAPIIFLGFHPQAMLLALAILVSYQFWIHVEWIPKLGFLEGIINTPSAHRVHHGANLEYVDSNYGGVLMIFDRMFGTYQEELDDVPVRYGLVKPLESYNPLKIAFHGVMPLVRDLRSARSVREVLGYLFGPPGWKPDGTGSTTEELRRRASAVAPNAAPSPT